MRLKLTFGDILSLSLCYYLWAASTVKFHPIAVRLLAVINEAEGHISVNADAQYSPPY